MQRLNRAALTAALRSGSNIINAELNAIRGDNLHVRLTGAAVNLSGTGFTSAIKRYPPAWNGSDISRVFGVVSQLPAQGGNYL